MKHIISILVHDEPGVMAKISGMFSRRGFNIDTITVGKTTQPGISKIVVTVIGDEKTLEQVEKQVNKLIDTIKVTELPERSSIIRELCLIQVALSSKKAKDDILNYAQVYKIKIVDLTLKSAIMEVVGEPSKVDSFIDLMKQFGIKEISRTGVTAIGRGENGSKKTN
ncbi:MAG TPA: acetolactate synthase small subunit [Candidatus Nanoarchaeia archaeon]|nr:acetolactate synthase small subunit [Candidatus Nanoarchaeia archaeon]